MTIPSHATQFIGHGTSESHTVVIGLDFGTSSSKVVLNNRAADKAFAIPFEANGHPSNNFLLPTRPYFTAEGSLRFASINDGIPLRELKGALIGNSASTFDFVRDKEIEVPSNLLAAAYLSEVIRFARFWFLTTQKNAFGHVTVDWQLNLGIPSTGKEFDAKKGTFQVLAECAWWLSTQEGDVTVEKTKKVMELVKKGPLNLHDIQRDNINIIPEIVAEVIGYVQSPQRKPGLHFLIDIGAGSVDIASFILHSDGGSYKYSILTGEVKWLGAFELHKHRIGIIKSHVAQWLDQLGKNEDPVKPVPDTADSYLPTAGQLDIKIDHKLDRMFYEECIKAIHETLGYLRKKRDPKSPSWQSGIPAFLCGGGSQSSFYNAALQDVDTWWKKNGTAGLKRLALPRPANFEARGLSDDEFHRLAVAYGLSFPEYDIGGIKPPGEIEDVPPPLPPKDYTDDFVDKDKV